MALKLVILLAVTLLDAVWMPFQICRWRRPRNWSPAGCRLVILLAVIRRMIHPGEGRSVSDPPPVILWMPFQIFQKASELVILWPSSAC